MYLPDEYIKFGMPKARLWRVQQSSTKMTLYMNTNFDRTPTTRSDATFRNNTITILQDFDVSGIRESSVAFYNVDGTVSNITLLDTALSTMAAQGYSIIFHIIQENTWSESVARSAISNIVNHYINTVPAIGRAIYAFMAPNEPDGAGWTYQEIINSNKYLYEEVKAIDPSKLVMSSPMVGGGLDTQIYTDCLNNGISEWCDLLDIHGYQTAHSPEFSNGGANSDCISTHWTKLAASGHTQRPTVNAEWGAGSEHAPSSICPSVIPNLTWMAACHKLCFVGNFRWGMALSSEYSLQYSGGGTDGEYNLYNYPGAGKLTGEADGPRPTVYDFVSAYVRSDIHDYRLFDGFTAQTTTIGTTYLHPNLVCFYPGPTTDQSSGAAWFYEWTRTSFGSNSHTQLSRPAGAIRTWRPLTNLKIGQSITVSVDCTVTGNGTATLALCGFNSTNGDLEQADSMTVGTGTLSVTVTPQLSAVCIEYKYQGTTGQAVWSNPVVTH